MPPELCSTSSTTTAQAFPTRRPALGSSSFIPSQADGTLGSPVVSGAQPYTTLQCFPGGVAVSANGNYAYVSNTNSVVVTTSPPSTPNPPATPSTCPSQGTISGFAVSSSGVLTQVPGSPFPAGTTPTSIAVDLTSRFVYTTDSVQNQIIVYNILGGGTLQPLTNGPFSTGTFPVGIVIDPRDKYIYITNYNSSTISAYTISQSTGQPSGLATSSFDTHGASPTCILVDPAFGRFVYTALSHDNLVSAAQARSQYRRTDRRTELAVHGQRYRNLRRRRSARQPRRPVRHTRRRPVSPDRQ